MKRSYAKKSLGQNFLIDQNCIERIISTLNLESGEKVVEIGAGRGALTGSLIETKADVIAIELDKNLIPVLQEEFGNYDNFQIIEQDALTINFEELARDVHRSPIENCKLVANLPYYISTAILQHLIQYRFSFSKMVLMLQREVVERVSAKPGDKERGFLTVLVQTYFEIDYLFDVSPHAFRPVPKVWSAVVCLRPKREIGIEDEKFYRDLISLSFQHKRKTIQNNLKNAGGILQEKIEKIGGLEKVFDAIGIKPSRRAESLNLEEWKRLFEKLSKVPKR